MYVVASSNEIDLRHDAHPAVTLKKNHASDKSMQTRQESLVPVGKLQAAEVADCEMGSSQFLGTWTPFEFRLFEFLLQVASLAFTPIGSWVKSREGHSIKIWLT